MSDKVGPLVATVNRYVTVITLFIPILEYKKKKRSWISPHSPSSSAACEAGLGFARLARTRAWSTASSRFLQSRASVWAAANICRWQSSFSEVTVFCWASRILLIRSPKSLFSSFLVPSIWCRGKDRVTRTASGFKVLRRIWHRKTHSNAVST